MTPLTNHLKRDKDILNLSELSRRIGFSRQYLKHVVAGRRHLSDRAEKLLTIELKELSTRYATDQKGI